MPRRFLITRAAREFAHGREIADRVRALGLPVMDLLSDDRTPPIAFYLIVNAKEIPLKGGVIGAD